MTDPDVVIIKINTAKLLAAGAEGITIKVTANQSEPTPEPLPTNPAEPEAA